MKRVVLLVLIALSMVVVKAAPEVSFTAQAPKAVVIGDNFRLTYTVNVSNAKKMRLPSVDGFQILAGPSTSTRSSTSFINGKVESSTTITYTYILVGEEEGEFVIPEATIEVSGKQYNSNSLKIKVLPQDDVQQSQGGQQRQQQSSRQGVQNQTTNSNYSGNGSISDTDLFMRAFVNKTKVYEQEAILLTFKVYSLVSLRSLSNKMPDLRNFHVQEVELPQNKEFDTERFNGRNYQTLIWSQYVLFPQQAGDLEIPATSFEGIVAQQVQSTDIFDMFFNGGRYVETKKDLVSNPITIHVDPLPSGKTSNFTGGVGDFSISSSINAETLKANEAVTIQVVLSGTGNMKLIKTPELKYPQDFDIYDPKVENKFTLKTNGQSGNKVFEYLAIPRHPGKYRIPPVDFQYFDINSHTYKTISTQEYVLNVEKGEGSDIQSISGYVSKEDLKYVGQDVRFRITNDRQVNRNSIFFGSTKFWLVMTMPLIFFVTVMLLNVKRVQDNANMARTKRKKANSVASKRLKAAKKLMMENRKDEFYDETLRAIWGYVSDKLSIPVANLSKEKIEEDLRVKGVSEALIFQLLEIMGNCEFARYAPGEESIHMDRVYKDSANIIGQLENMIKR